MVTELYVSVNYSAFIRSYSNLLLVTPGGSFGPVRGGEGAGRLTAADAEAIARLPMVRYVAPEVSAGVTAAYGRQAYSTTVSGTTPELQQIKNWPTLYGAFFTREDVNRMAAVAVLGKTVADNLFLPGTNPVGEKIRINGLSFTVTGVLAPLGASLGGSDQDNVIYVPLTTAQQKLIGTRYVRLINVQAESAAALPALQEAVRNTLRQRHHLAPGAEDDFNIRNMEAVLSAVEDTTRVMTFLLGGIAAVSLVVGGIGIMNIMLVSVTERTKEIGIRMAVGATPSAILAQFLAESLLLSVAGGAAGALLGWLAVRLAVRLAGWQMVFTPWVTPVAVGFAALVGLFFGYYPAKKAASADPIEALRFE
ncbi:ABC transporter permease [Desulfovirgula thermocuniculi]|uniref:ABC transporter permease n=1 Tax=Desulfovirgula thermocuniculi TaxID=348842 RepID=UPI0003F764F3|nr:ABC transporter permease [Desulfovirgula thermocuniculi]